MKDKSAVDELKSTESQLKALSALNYKIVGVTLEAPGAPTVTLRSGVSTVLSTVSIDYDNSLQDELTGTFYGYFQDRFVRALSLVESQQVETNS